MDENRILDKLDDISNRMTRVETTVEGLSGRIDKYNNVTGRVKDLEHKIDVVVTNCARIQTEKADVLKRRSIPWGAIIGSIMSGTIVGLIMLAANRIQ
jgi:tetrahydromethanopterin S-methyltransferase subunit G